jgi:hypothetical protein
VNSEIEPEPGQRVVDVGGIAGEKDAPLAERCRDILMDVVQVAVDNRIRCHFREESLQPLLDSLVEG